MSPLHVSPRSAFVLGRWPNGATRALEPTLGAQPSVRRGLPRGDRSTRSQRLRETRRVVDAKVGCSGSSAATSDGQKSSRSGRPARNLGRGLAGRSGGSLACAGLGDERAGTLAVVF